MRNAKIRWSFCERNYGTTFYAAKYTLFSAYFMSLFELHCFAFDLFDALDFQCHFMWSVTSVLFEPMRVDRFGTRKKNSIVFPSLQTLLPAFGWGESYGRYRARNQVVGYLRNVRNTMVSVDFLKKRRWTYYTVCYFGRSKQSDLS